MTSQNAQCSSRSGFRIFKMKGGGQPEHFLIPLVTCENPLCHDVCELVLAVDIFDLDFGDPD